MDWPLPSPAVERSSLIELPLSVVLSGGLPDRYRIPFVVFFAVFSVGGLLVLAYKLRTADPEAMADREITSKLERKDLLEGGEPSNFMEWVIKVANRADVYLVMIVLSFGLAVVGLTTGWFPTLAGVMLFGGALFSVQAFLRFVWPYFENYYDRRQPDERDPHAFEFQGFSTDMMIFLTLFVLSFLGVMTLILLESRLT